MVKNKKENTAEETNLAMLSHLLGIFTGFIGPLIIYLVAKEDQKFVKQNARNSLNFQISLFIILFLLFLYLF